MTILVADDIIFNRALIREITESEGITCIEAVNGREALSLLESHKVDLVLLDIEMPVMNGLETIAEIRRHPLKKIRELPVVALTAHHPENFFNNSAEARFNNILTKPYSPERVMAMIKNYC